MADVRTHPVDLLFRSNNDWEMSSTLWQVLLLANFTWLAALQRAANAQEGNTSKSCVLAIHSLGTILYCNTISIKKEEEIYQSARFVKLRILRSLVHARSALWMYGNSFVLRQYRFKHFRRYLGHYTNDDHTYWITIWGITNSVSLCNVSCVEFVCTNCTNRVTIVTLRRLDIFVWLAATLVNTTLCIRSSCENNSSRI